MGCVQRRTHPSQPWDRNHNTRDFWTLSKKGSFRAETDNYVPKLLAAAIIGKNPERYGFTGIEKHEPLSQDTVTVSANVGIDVLARCAGISVDEFRALNPQLRRWALPPSPARQLVHVPKDKSRSFLAALDKIPSDKRITHRRHKAKRGESLGTIARKYGVSSGSIQSVNKIRNANRIAVGQELVIPVSGQAGATSLAASRGGEPATTVKRPAHHTVRRGQTLSGMRGSTASRARTSRAGTTSRTPVESRQDRSSS